MIALLKRAWLRYRIRALLITIHGQGEVLAMVGDPLLEGRVVLARHAARCECARLQREYNALLPAGKQRHWGLA
jgi:hypothetical protein